MNNLYFILALLLVGCFSYSCKKLDPAPHGDPNKTTGSDTTTQPLVLIDPGLLTGTWQVINDTTTQTPWGIWDGRPVTGVNYVGTIADHYTFTADGHMYDFMQGHADTATYTISKNQVDIEYTYTNNARQPEGLYHGLFTFIRLGPHTASFSTLAVSPEVAYSSVTHLRK